jgi:hypothetical protein
MSTRSSLGKIPYATKEPKWVRRKGARHRMSRANRGLRFADPPYGLILAILRLLRGSDLNIAHQLTFRVAE